MEFNTIRAGWFLKMKKETDLAAVSFLVLISIIGITVVVELCKFLLVGIWRVK